LYYSGIATVAFGTGNLVNRELVGMQPVARQVESHDPLELGYVAWRKRAGEIYARHYAQTTEDVKRLVEKYSSPAFGRIRTMTCFEKLGRCIDPTDRALVGTSQLLHTLQTLEGMERDGISDPDLLIAAAVHDFGKILLLTDEAPENVVCANTPIGDYPDAVGLDNVVFQWNHDEFAYVRLKDYLPDHVSWLVRYHSVDFRKTAPLMDDRDRYYFERYLRVFRRYDSGTKSITHVPEKRLESYESLIRSYLPEYIVV